MKAKPKRYQSEEESGAFAFRSVVFRLITTASESCYITPVFYDPNDDHGGYVASADIRKVNEKG